ncbi:pentatricopeptide repeat (PPR) superfamily protein [Striga asiatica]|uniref:Pentatricopeptide repeat (PPR) superfamily protein n=1 Tax=Striga asiatica TaxID=4170 RepID=A0A5A7R2S5_STRAF|nr:pentatricopeptide repeat (PPR) superfamily protein [Striga asiatica]
MMAIESHAAAAASRISAAVNIHSSTRILAHSSSFLIPRIKYRRCAGRLKNAISIRASAKKQSGSDSGPVKPNAKPQRYHPSEEIAEPRFLDNGEAKLTAAETSRTIIEVNSKGTLMFSGVDNEEISENIFWQDFPYVTDEHGNVYFQVKTNEDILQKQNLTSEETFHDMLQTVTSEETVVQVIIGLDTKEMMSEMEALGLAETDFGMDELDDSEFDDEDEDDEEEDDDEYDESGEDEDDEVGYFPLYFLTLLSEFLDFQVVNHYQVHVQDWVDILDEENGDEEIDGSLRDWAKLDTMRSSHPMYFAEKLAEVVSDDPVDCMKQLSAGLVIHGLLRPAFIEEHSVVQRQISNPESSDVDTDINVDGGVHVNGHRHAKEFTRDNVTLDGDLEKDESLGNGFAFYKLEMIKILLVSAQGVMSEVEIEDFRRAKPDAIAHSAAKIISRLKAGGEKTMQALKSLCWRSKGIQVEECALIGVDSLGFDVRVCSGTQLQTLRFGFKKKASSEYSAERQLNDLLFPRTHKYQQKKEAQQTES